MKPTLLVLKHNQQKVSLLAARIPYSQVTLLLSQNEKQATKSRTDPRMLLRKYYPRVSCSQEPTLSNIALCAEQWGRIIALQCLVFHSKSRNTHWRDPRPHDERVTEYIDLLY